MSEDVSRSYLIPSDRLADAFAATAEILAKSREPEEHRIDLPDGTSIGFPAAPDLDMPHELEPGRVLDFDLAIRFGAGDDVDAYLRQEPEAQIQVKRLKSGGLRSIAYLGLTVSIQPPFARFTFSTSSGRFSHCEVLDLPSLIVVLDYVGRSAGWLLTFVSGMGEDRLVEPFESALPYMGDEDDSPRLARIVEWVRAREAE